VKAVGSAVVQSGRMSSSEKWVGRVCPQGGKPQPKEKGKKTGNFTEANEGNEGRETGKIIDGKMMGPDHSDAMKHKERKSCFANAQEILLKLCNFSI